jgi:hypothetical protein
MKKPYEIQKMFELANQQALKESKVFGMSYEQGVEAALGWVLGAFDEDPLEETKEER